MIKIVCTNILLGAVITACAFLVVPLLIGFVMLLCKTPPRYPEPEVILLARSPIAELNTRALAYARIMPELTTVDVGTECAEEAD